MSDTYHIEADDFGAGTESFDSHDRVSELGTGTETRSLRRYGMHLRGVDSVIGTETPSLQNSGNHANDLGLGREKACIRSITLLSATDEGISYEIGDRTIRWDEILNPPPLIGDQEYGHITYQLRQNDLGRGTESIILKVNGVLIIGGQSCVETP